MLAQFGGGRSQSTQVPDSPHPVSYNLVKMLCHLFWAGVGYGMFGPDGLLLVVASLFTLRGKTRYLWR